MKTTIDIPERLMSEAMLAAGAKTKRETVLRALEELNRRYKLQALAEQLGNSETFMSSDELTAIRARELSAPESGK